MSPAKFFSLVCRPCSAGHDFAIRYATMFEVWNACPRIDWLFWIVYYHRPLSLEDLQKMLNELARVNEQSVQSTFLHNRIGVMNAMLKRVKDDYDLRVMRYSVERLFNVDASNVARYDQLVLCDLFRRVIANPFT